jgi:hypothetical protein
MHQIETPGGAVTTVVHHRKIASTALLLGVTTIAFGACSEEAGNTNATTSWLPAVTLAGPVPPNLFTVAVATPDADISTSVPLNRSYAMAITVPSLASCTVHPVGITTDPSRTSWVSAADDGKVRFYAPPPTWGANLQFDCTLGSNAPDAYRVDLNDGSTFKIEQDADLEPELISVRPALTGDLTTISLETLAQGNYPPRPDAVQNSERYAKWVKSVTAAVNVLRPFPVARLGVAGGAYIGSEPTSNWAGMVQSASGFHSGAPLGWIANAGTTRYTEYMEQLNVPSVISCPTGQCGETLIWAGIGGYPTTWFGTQVGTPIIQSGFDLLGVNDVKPFFEFAPSQVMDLPPPTKFKYASNDLFTIWGKAAGSSNCETNNSAPWACFWFEDDTNSWMISASTPTPGGTWLPSTAEYVAEYIPPGRNPDYFGDSAIGTAWDSQGNQHQDPGGPYDNGDAYIVTTDIPAADPVQYFEWNNGTTTSPQDPMFFIWESAQ